MASKPIDAPTSQELMTLGMFVFGMDSLPYQNLLRSTEFRHGSQERHGARPARQFLGPGAQSVTITGLLVPEVAGEYAALETLEEMGGTGDDYPLMDGYGRVFGNFIIKRMDEEHRNILAGGIPRQKSFTIELERVD